jgi:hypothetical protein
MIKQINFGSNTAFSQFYVPVKKLDANLDIALSSQMLGISINKLLAKLPVIEVDEQGNETVIATPSVRQLVEAINPSQLSGTFKKTFNGVQIEFIVIIAPVSPMIDGSGQSELTELTNLMMVLNNGDVTPEWTGNIYTQMDFQTLVDSFGGWEE